MGKIGGVKVSKKTKDVEHIKSDVASFASSLGFSSAHSSSAGFNDSDFRKTGTLKPYSRPLKNSNRDKTKNPHEKENKSIPKNNNKRNNPKFDVKSAQIQTPNFSSGNLLKERDSKFKNLPKLPLLKASAMSVWYKDAALLDEKMIGDSKRIEFKSVDEWKGLVKEKEELGERLMAQYVQDYESSRGQSGDIKMLIATQRSGTAADKVSAFSVLVGDNPVANLRSIDMLLGMVTSKVGKRHALAAFEALKELFILSLLPDRKLKTLVQQPLNHLSDTKDGYSLLLFWYWEECLKERYERFVSALEEASQDVLDILRNKALKTMYTLLRSKSEQERRLLSALVNKLGHPENKVASNADYHLANLLADHPNMKAVVIDEVDNFLFRPHLGLRAKYHAVNFLSQIRLSHKGDGPKAAKRLIDIYFALFKVLISEASKAPPTVAKQSEAEKKPSSSLKENKPKSLSESHIGMDSRLLSALLTGVNRAFPFVSGDEADDVIEVQTPLLFQLVHSKNFNVGVQALMLLDKISSKNQIVSDRFYRALYSKLLLPAAISSSKEELFIGLMLRAMKNDVNIKRVAAFSKRLLQVALQLPPQYACGCLFLLSEVLKARPPLWNMVLQNESVDEDLEHFEDILDEDNKQASLVPDSKDDKEISQTSDKSDSDSDSSLDKGGSMIAGSDEDDLSEAYGLLGKDGVECKELKPASHSKGGGHLQREKDSLTLPGGYNPRHREPSYCNADRVSWWELMVLASHVHPSVAAMARTLLSGANIVYSGNPLNDLSLGSFLDKFMEKKPRQSTWHGASQIEPAKKLDVKNQLIGPEIVSLAEEDVPPEDLVFHKFYMNKMNSSKKPKKKKKKTADDEAAEEFYAVDGDDDDDESDNEEIENVFDSANPALDVDVDGNYNYDDLDKIVNEDDDDLIGRGSDEDDFPSDIASMEIDDVETLSGDDEEENEEDIVIGAADDDSDVDEGFNQKKKKQKSNKHSAASPFASLEDYQHLMDDSNSTKITSTEKRSRKGKKKVSS